MYQQGAPKRDGGGRGVGPGPTAVLGDVHHRAPAQEGHVGGQTPHGGGTAHAGVGDAHPVTVDHQPQLGLHTGGLGGEEELVHPFDRSPEHPGSSVEASAHVHQNLTVLDSVHLAHELSGIGREEVDFSGRH